VYMGYTTLALGLALPEGAKIVALDINDKYLSVGQKYWNVIPLQFLLNHFFVIVRSQIRRKVKKKNTNDITLTHTKLPANFALCHIRIKKIYLFLIQFMVCVYVCCVCVCVCVCVCKKEKKKKQTCAYR